MIGRLEDAKKVPTLDPSKAENGFLLELFKDGEKTVLYLTTIKPGMFKGYHLHRVRASRYICIKGKGKITLQKPGESEREEYILDSQNPQRLFIPKDTATGIYNIGDEEVWFINYPDPSYDPNLKDEQVEYTEEELEKGVVK